MPRFIKMYVIYNLFKMYKGLLNKFSFSKRNGLNGFWALQQ